MGCGSCSSKLKPMTYVWTSADGKQSVPYKTEVEARAKKARSGGTFKAA